MKKVKHPPLYLLAKEEIVHYIVDKGLSGGDFLPSEGELCSRLGISRGTLREAMRVLEEEDVVIRKQGIGTYVTHRDTVIHSTLDFNEGVTEMIMGRGMTPGAHNVRIEEMTADRKLAQKLQVDIGAPLLVVKRLRTANDIPVAYTEDFSPKEVIPDKLLRDSKKASLYSILEEDLGIELGTSALRLEPLKASKTIARALGIKPGDLLMFLQQTDKNIDKIPVLYSEEYFAAQRFEFVVMRRRKVKLSNSY